MTSQIQVLRLFFIKNIGQQITLKVYGQISTYRRFEDGNRRHDRTCFDRVMVSGVSQNALKQSQRPP